MTSASAVTCNDELPATKEFKKVAHLATPPSFSARVHFWCFDLQQLYLICSNFILYYLKQRFLIYSNCILLLFFFNLQHAPCGPPYEPERKKHFTHFER